MINICACTPFRSLFLAGAHYSYRLLPNRALHATGDGVLACNGLLSVAARRAARLSAPPRSGNVDLPRRVNARSLAGQISGM